MKLIHLLLIFSGTMIAAYTSLAQTDKEHIEHANNAISVVHKCDDALRLLNNVSAEGRMTANYFLCLAKAHDCKENLEQAIYYYNKYLEMQPKSDSVKQRVAQLADKQTQQGRTANEERVAKAVYDNIAHPNKKKKHYILEDKFLYMGPDFSFSTGGRNAAYKYGAGLNLGSAYNFFDNNLVLDFSLSGCFQFGKNLPWFRRAYPKLGSSVDIIDNGGSVAFEVSPMLTIINSHSIAWTAGPLAGIKYANISISGNSLSGAVINGENVFGPCYGVKSDFLWGQCGMVFVEYAMMPRDRYNTETNTKGILSDHNVLRIGINLKVNRYQ